MRTLVETAADILNGKLDEAKKPLHPNQQKLDIHEPEKDELTAKDFEMLRKGKTVATVKEELKGDIHPDADEVLKHIEPEHRRKYLPWLKKGTYKIDSKRSSYADRSAILRAAERAGHTVKDVTEGVIEETIIKEDSFEVTLPKKLEYSDYVKAYLTLEGVTSFSELSEEQLHLALETIEVAYENRVEDLVIEALSWEEIGKLANRKDVTDLKTKIVNGKPHVSYVMTDKNGMKRRYLHHGNIRRVENIGQTVKPDSTDED